VHSMGNILGGEEEPGPSDPGRPHLKPLPRTAPKTLLGFKPHPLQAMTVTTKDKDNEEAEFDRPQKAINGCVQHAQMC